MGTRWRRADGGERPADEPGQGRQPPKAGAARPALTGLVGRPHWAIVLDGRRALDGSCATSRSGGGVAGLALGGLSLAPLAHAVAGELDAVSVVEQAIEDGVGVSRVADELVPIVDRDLTGDDGRAAAVAGLEDLEKIVTSGGIERCEAPVVEDEQLDAAEHAQQPSIAAVATGEREIGEQLWHALVEHRSVIAAGLVAERTSEPALADAGRAADHQGRLPSKRRRAKSQAVAVSRA